MMMITIIITMRVIIVIIGARVGRCSGIRGRGYVAE
jgi:hypothetical protein